MSEGQCADGDAWEGAGVGGLGREEPGPPWGQVQETQQPPGGAARWLLVRPVGGGGRAALGRQKLAKALRSHKKPERRSLIQS